MTTRDGRTVLGYQDHYLVDGGKARIILHAFVTPGDVAENMVLLDQLSSYHVRRKLHPKHVIADAKYATTTNIRTLEDAGMQAYVPLPEWDKSSSRFKRAAFAYDPTENVYRCPQGEVLRLRWTDRKGEQWFYRARAAACNAVRGEGTVHDEQPGAVAAPILPRSLSRAGARLCRHPGLQAGDAQAQHRGSRGCSPRPSSGMACTGFGCAAWRTSTSRRSWWRPVRT